MSSPPGPPLRHEAAPRRRLLVGLVLCAVGLIAVGVWVASAAGSGQPEDAREAPATPGPTERAVAPSPTDGPSPAPSPTDPDAVPTPTPADPLGLDIHFMDVGQGDATLLRTPDATVLIDTGRHDRDDVVGYLRRAGVEALDVVIVTHPHADHLGQFDRVLDAFPVAEVWWSGSTHTTRTFERAVAALEASDAAYAEPRAGDATEVGDLSFAFVNPPEDADFDDLHDASLAFRVDYGEVSVLFTGDAEAPTEERMVARHVDALATDVYQVGHHGSATSTSQAFLDAVGPRLAVHSAGAANQYGHPHEEVTARLADAGVVVLGTETHGSVVVTTDGRQIRVEPARGEAFTLE